MKEQKDDSCRPEIEALPDVEGVDEIWVGYPIWWYSHPRIINTFFDSVELEGVKIHLFATSGGSGIQNSFRELKITYPGLSFIDAKMM